MLSVAFDQWLACDRCDGVFRRTDLNTEAILHHGQRELRCTDERACARRVRKASR